MNMLAKIAGVICLGCFQISAAQTGAAATTDIGPLPFHSYSGGGFDHIQMQNGSMWFNVPLYSLPQLGTSALSFSLAGHSSSASPTATCATNGGCYSAYLDTDSPTDSGWTFEGGEATYGNVRIEHDQAVALYSKLVNASTSTSTSYGPINYYQIHKLYQLRDGSGAMHQLGYDSSDYSLLHATDGSGWSVKLPISGTAASIFQPTGTGNLMFYAFDSKGIKYSLEWEVASAQDPHGNSISANADPSAGQYSSNLYQSLTDSISRTVALKRTSTSTANCPNLGISDQPVTGSSLWSVPGPNGGSLSFQICYSTYALKTNYWGGEGSSVYVSSPPIYDDYGNVVNQGSVDIWAEMSGPTVAIQSVLLADDNPSSGQRSFWGFVYDTPAVGYQYTYGNVVEIRTPEGGSTHYSYDLRSVCGQPVYSPSTASLYPRVSSVTARTASSGSGPSINTGYTYAATQTTETTAGNDTVHLFTLVGQSCGAFETETKYFQGASASNIVLKDVTTSFDSQASPQDNILGAPEAPPVNVRPYTVTTQMTGQASHSETYTYEPLFTDIEPVWDGGSSYTTLPSVVMYSTLPISTSDGVRTEATPSYWSTHPGYKAANLLDLRASVQVLDASNQQVAYRTFQYDENNGSPQGTYGNLTSTNYWVGSGTTLSDGAVFNAQGMTASSSDRRGTVTQINSFQCQGLFPASITVASGTSVAQTSSQTRDCNTGLVTATTDPNGVNTAFDRNDPLGRVTQVRAAISTSVETHTTYSYPSRTEIDVAQDKITINDGVITSRQTYDGLGRIVQEIAPGGSVVDTTYDGAGNVSSKSNAHWASATNVPATSYAYDGLGRRTMQCNQDNGTGSSCSAGTSYKQWSYGAGQVVRRDEVGSQWTDVYDSLGRLTSVTEPSGGSVAAYTYNPLGSLLTADQSDGGGNSRHREFHYDGLQHLTLSYNPESGWVCYGTTSNQPATQSNCSPQYDPNGNLLYKTDSRGTTISYSYDPLNRLTLKVYSDGTTPAVGYFYDHPAPGVPGAQNLMGRLAMSAVGSTQAFYSYDPLGRVYIELMNSPINLGGYFAVAGYDLAGNMSWLGYPDQRLVTQDFDAAGRLIGSTNQALGGLTQNFSYLPSVSYDAAGQVTSETMGNGVTQSATYDNRNRLQSLAYFNNGTTLWGKQYSYFANSNVQSTTDLVSGGTRQFSYDSLNRLTSAVDSGSPNGMNQSFTYDEFGNLLQNGSFNASYDSNNRMVGWAYDPTGNLLSNGVTSFAWDGAGRMAASTGTTYFYDAEDNRIEKHDSNYADTVYFGGRPIARWVLVNGGVVLTDLIYGPSGLLAEVSNGSADPTYRLSDHLGNQVRTVDASGTASNVLDYTPFGMLFSGSTSDPYMFTGKERDAESGLDYFGTRFYGSSIGRWISPDLINVTEERLLTPSPTFNKYAYAADNPLKYVDPDGQDVTIFFENGVPGHIMMMAYDPSLSSAATRSFGPATSFASGHRGSGDTIVGLPVPATTKFGFGGLKSADDIRHNYATLTIQTSPEVTQQVVQALVSHSGDRWYTTFGNACASSCARILRQIEQFKDTGRRNALLPYQLFDELYEKYGNGTAATRWGDNTTNVFKPGSSYGAYHPVWNAFDVLNTFINPSDKRPTRGCYINVTPNGNTGNC